MINKTGNSSERFPANFTLIWIDILGKKHKSSCLAYARAIRFARALKEAKGEIKAKYWQIIRISDNIQIAESK